MYQDVEKELMLGISFPANALARKCEVAHLPIISTNFKWRIVAPYLKGLTPQQIADVEFDGKTEQERRMKCLLTWCEALGDMATYGNLMRALLQSNLKDQALHVMAILLRAHAPVPCGHILINDSSKKTFANSCNNYFFVYVCVVVVVFVQVKLLILQVGWLAKCKMDYSVE